MTGSQYKGVIDFEEIVTAHERLLDQSHRMLSLARNGQWEELVAEESSYVIAVDKLMLEVLPASLPDEVQEMRVQVLEQLLEHSAEIQRHLLARREELTRLIGDSRRKQNVERAYFGSSLGSDSLQP